LGQGWETDRGTPLKIKGKENLNGSGGIASFQTNQLRLIVSGKERIKVMWDWGTFEMGHTPKGGTPIPNGVKQNLKRYQ